MKKLIAIFLSVFMLVTLSACGSTGSVSQKNTTTSSAATAALKDKVSDGNHKVLITYFSWGGNTEKAAKEIQAVTGGDLFRIEPAKGYPTEYTPTTEIAKKELADNARPEVRNKVTNMADYDVVFVGYPIWWGTAPMAVFTFMESYDFTGKTVIPFCTSGGSSIDKSLKDMQSLAAKGTVVKGFNCNDSAGIKPWLTSIGMAK
jgi:flavodoxin/predicted small lipoprotein YifL